MSRLPNRWIDLGAEEMFSQAIGRFLKGARRCGRDRKMCPRSLTRNKATPTVDASSMGKETRKLGAPEDLEALLGTLDDIDLVVFTFPVGNNTLPEDLSAAEHAVILGALAGKSNTEIADARATSVRTVANQIASAFRKLGVSSRRELAARVLGGLHGGTDAGA